MCKANGLTIAEIDDLNIGRIIDYIYDYNDILTKRYGANNNDTEREATQEDMDNFFGD